MFEPNRDDTQYVLSISYGKDSLACLGACKLLGWRIDRIIHAEVWATDTIPADLPPMVEFKKKADRIIKERFGIEVEHYCATKVDNVSAEKVTYEKYMQQTMTAGKFIGSEKGFPMSINPWCNKLKLNAIEEAEKMTYEKMFYHVREKGYRKGEIAGFPFNKAPECNAALKRPALAQIDKTLDGMKTVSFIGIAADEPERLARLDNDRKVSPLAAIGWTEADAMKWCIENDLRSPLYDDCNRGGCWFCHNQGVDQLRKLRHKYPDLWAILMQWDLDSPVTFKSDGHTVHDYDKRFELEDKGVVSPDERWYWKYLSSEWYGKYVS